MRPSSDQGLMDLQPSLVPSKGDPLGTKIEGPEFLQSRAEIVTGYDPMRITEKVKSGRVRGWNITICTKACVRAQILDLTEIK